MAQFYGTVSGQRGEASRLGSKSSGLRTVAASWQGAIEVWLRHDETRGVDTFSVAMTPHQGHGDRIPIAAGDVGRANTVRPATFGHPLAIPDPDLVALARNAGALHQEQKLTFTLDELREFLRQAMTHAELHRS